MHTPDMLRIEGLTIQYGADRVFTFSPQESSVQIQLSRRTCYTSACRFHSFLDVKVLLQPEAENTSEGSCLE
jgi:hypothetical protein